MKFFASRESFYNTLYIYIYIYIYIYNSWRFYHPHDDSSIKLGCALFSEGVSAETIATPLYPPLQIGLITLFLHRYVSGNSFDCGISFYGVKDLWCFNTTLNLRYCINKQVNTYLGL